MADLKTSQETTGGALKDADIFRYSEESGGAFTSQKQTFAAIKSASVAPTPITVAAAQALVTAGTVVVGRVYSITDSASAFNAADRIWIRGVGPDEFDQNALYIDSVNNTRNRAIYRIDATPTDELIFRADNKGNEIFDIIGGACITNFEWDSDFWSGNKTTTGFNLSSNPEQFIDNYLQESVTISSSSQTGTQINRNILKASASVILTAASATCNSNIIGQGSTVNVANNISGCIIGDGCSIDDGGFEISGVIFPPGTTYTAAADITNATFSENGFRCGTDFLIAEGLLRTFNAKNLAVLVSNNGIFEITVGGTGGFKVNGLNNYANNAAALADGKVAGDFYYTDTAGEATLKIVI